MSPEMTLRIASAIMQTLTLYYTCLSIWSLPFNLPILKRKFKPRSMMQRLLSCILVASIVLYTHQKLPNDCTSR